MASARHLLPQGRLRVWSLEIGGQIVASEVFLAAGGHVSAWLGGFDGASERLSPSLQLILRALEDGFERGDERLDLGPSAQPDFKARFTESRERLAWVTIGPRGSARWRGRAVAAATAAPHRLGERLTAEQKSLIRKVVPRI
jgi:CelD/BcsL family acetyltransferase involved in cellulose biosynthesis